MRLERFIGVLEGLRISGMMVRVSTQYACEKPADYRAKLGDAHEIEVTGLDSVRTGRMAITYYRELTGSEFLDPVSDSNAGCSWFKNDSNDNRFVDAPVQRRIAAIACGEASGSISFVRLRWNDCCVALSSHIRLPDSAR
jgi:hypothetical protein